MKIVVFGAGQMGKAIAQYFLYQSELSQLRLIDINEQQLMSCQIQLANYVNTNKLILNKAENIEQYIAEADLIFTAIPWFSHADIINMIAYYNKPTIIISRPEYHELEKLKIKLQNMTQPVIVGAGLEPGLTEIVARYCAKLFGKLDSLHIKCGGLTAAPVDNVLGYKSLFGTQYLPISMRQAYTFHNSTLIEVPRFSDIELVNIPEIGQLEAWHDGMVPWLCEYPEISTAQCITQKTLRWPGFANIVQQLHGLGLLSEKNIKIDNLNISPKKFIDYLYAEEARLTNEDNITVLQVLAHGLSGSGLKQTELKLIAKNQMEIGLNSLALLTGFIASIIGLLILNGDNNIVGLSHPECIVMPQNLEAVIDELKKYSIQFNIKNSYGPQYV